MSAVDDLARAFCRDHEHDSITWAGVPCCDCREFAEDACQKLRCSRWRIVRGDDLGPTECFVDGPNIHVVDEWHPVSGDQQ